MVRFQLGSVDKTQIVESSFGEVERQAPKRMSQQDVIKLRDRVTIALCVTQCEVFGKDPNLLEPQRLLLDAMSLYKEFFGGPRRRCNAVVGTLARGRKRKCRDNSENSFMKRQKAALKRLASEPRQETTMFGTAMPANLANIQHDPAPWVQQGKFVAALFIPIVNHSKRNCLMNVPRYVDTQKPIV